jgi:hypothetical protein
VHQILAAAIEDVRVTYPGKTVSAVEQPDGSAWVILHAVDIGTGWTPSVIDLGVKLQPTFPSTPPYPFYGPGGLARTDGRAYPPVQPQVTLDGADRAQISLTKPFNPTFETLGTRFATVIRWLRNPS